MKLEDLKRKLCKYGLVQIIKEGYVFTVLITGANLSNYKNVSGIQKDIIDYAGSQL